MADGSREENLFIEGYLQHEVKNLSPADLDVYREPYPDPRVTPTTADLAARDPPDGKPADVHERVLGYGRWMSETPDVPRSPVP